MKPCERETNAQKVHIRAAIVANETSGLRLKINTLTRRRSDGYAYSIVVYTKKKIAEWKSEMHNPDDPLIHSYETTTMIAAGNSKL